MTDKKRVYMDVPYFQTPNKIFDVEGLSIYEKMAYIYLARCGNQGASAFPSYKTIGEKCGMSRRKAIDAVKKLEELNLLAKKKRRYNAEINKTNLYKVIPPSECDALGNAQPAPSSAQTALNDKELMYKEQIEKESYMDLPVHGYESSFIYEKIHNQYFDKPLPRIKQTDSDLLDQLQDIYYSYSGEELEEILHQHFANLPDDNDGSLNYFIHIKDRYLKGGWESYV